MILTNRMDISPNNTPSGLRQVPGSKPMTDSLPQDRDASSVFMVNEDPEESFVNTQLGLGMGILTRWYECVILTFQIPWSAEAACGSLALEEGSGLWFGPAVGEAAWVKAGLDPTELRLKTLQRAQCGCGKLISWEMPFPSGVSNCLRGLSFQ